MDLQIPLRSVSRLPSLARMGLGVVLLAPAALIFGAAALTLDSGNYTFIVGTVALVLLGGMSVVRCEQGQQTAKPTVIALHGLGIVCLAVGPRILPGWYPQLAQAVFLMSALGAFALFALVKSGATALRRAHLLSERIAARTEFPKDLQGIRNLSEVRAFREALQVDASPALALLNHPRTEVRVAALCALEFRARWRPGQAEIVLNVAQFTKEPLLRAAALFALGNTIDQVVVESLAEYFRDPHPVVRQAAAEALLRDSGKKWPWIRAAVRRALTDGALLTDGPLRPGEQLLAQEVVNDLTGWAAEKGNLSVRAALTLAMHFQRAFNLSSDPGMLRDIKQRVENPQTPPILRMELARLLQLNRELDPKLLDRLLMPMNPAPLRLLAAELLLENGDHADAVAALHDLGRLPNREIALATADVVQRRLGVDLGLVPGEPLPPLHSRLAAEITRRVIQWATKHDLPDNVADSRPAAR